MSHACQAIPDCSRYLCLGNHKVSSQWNMESRELQVCPKECTLGWNHLQEPSKILCVLWCLRHPQGPEDMKQDLEISPWLKVSLDNFSHLKHHWTSCLVKCAYGLITLDFPYNQWTKVSTLRTQFITCIRDGHIIAR